MRFYPHHIGDFRAATRHLSRLECAMYRELLDTYYDTEAPLPADERQLFRKVCAKTKAERAAVLGVLGEFFILTDDGYRHPRCDQEIADYRERCRKASNAAKQRGRQMRKAN